MAHPLGDKEIRLGEPVEPRLEGGVVDAADRATEYR
jgi:hypothetical protein